MNFGITEPRRLAGLLLSRVIPNVAISQNAMTQARAFGLAAALMTAGFGFAATAPAYAQDDGAVADESEVDAEAAADEIMGDEAGEDMAANEDAAGEVPEPLPEATAPEISLDDIEFAVHSDFAARQLLLDVAKAGDRLVAVGEFGHIVYSDDAGKTWVQAERVPTQVTLTSVAFPSDKVGYAAGHDSKILKTEDGGKTWNLVFQDAESQNPIMAIYFVDEDHGFAMGAFSLFVETEDGGKTWRFREMPVGEDDFVQFHLNDIFQSATSGTVFVAAEAGNVYRSKDEGRTWEMVSTPYDGSFWNGTVLEDGRVMIVGMRGHAFYSDDEGDSWTQAEVDGDKSIGGVTQLSDGTVVLTGLQGYVGYSTDNGETFTAIARRDRLGFAAVAEADGDQIAIFGEPGVRLMPNDAEAAEKAVGSKSSLANPS